jgi:hypothetical protein
MSRRGNMDLNYLFHRQQVERTRAEAADSEPARKAHEQLAREYEKQITCVTEGNVKFPEGEEPADEAA